MNEFSIWEAANVVCRLGVVAVVVCKLWRFYDHYKPAERFGLGVLGGCALMTIPVLMEGPASPFAEWAGAFFTFGVLVYLGGRLRRQINHDNANAEMVRRAKGRKA